MQSRKSGMMSNYLSMVKGHGRSVKILVLRVPDCTTYFLRITLPLNTPLECSDLMILLDLNKKKHNPANYKLEAYK